MSIVSHVCALVLTGQHLSVGAVRDGKQMGWHFSATTATVQLHYSVGVDGEALVRVDYDAEQTRVGLQWRAAVESGERKSELVKWSGSGEG